jgi:hypothetical protein
MRRRTCALGLILAEFQTFWKVPGEAFLLTLFKFFPFTGADVL